MGWGDDDAVVVVCNVVPGLGRSCTWRKKDKVEVGFQQPVVRAKCSHRRGMGWKSVAVAATALSAPFVQVEPQGNHMLSQSSSHSHVHDFLIRFAGSNTATQHSNPRSDCYVTQPLSLCVLCCLLPRTAACGTCEGRAGASTRARNARRLECAQNTSLPVCS